MQGDKEWYKKSLKGSIRNLEEYLITLSQQGVVILPQDNYSNICQVYNISEWFERKYQYVKLQGWEQDSEIEELREKKDEIDQQWQALENQIPQEEKLTALTKCLADMIDRYEAYTEVYSELIFEERLDLLMIRDDIEMLVQILSQKVELEAYQKRLEQADQLLKVGYQQDKWSLDCYTIEYRDWHYVPETYWWWYLDQDPNL